LDQFVCIVTLALGMHFTLKGIPEKNAINLALANPLYQDSFNPSTEIFIGFIHSTVTLDATGAIHPFDNNSKTITALTTAQGTGPLSIPLSQTGVRNTNRINRVVEARSTIKWRRCGEDCLCGETCI
jgi:hypothetical protein